MMTQRKSDAHAVDRPAGAAARSKVTPISSAIRVAQAASRDGTASGQKDKPRILFLDDEERILNALNAVFRHKYQVFTTTDPGQALEILKRQHVHLVISDQRMPAMTGVDFLRQVKGISPGTMRVLLTGFSDLSAIIGSVNDGEVYRFVNKPWGNQEIQAIIADAVSIGLELERTAGNMPAPAVATITAASSVGGVTTLTSQGEAILVAHDRREVFDEIRAMMGGSHACLYARSLAECFDALRQNDVAVIVSGLEVGRQDNSVLFKLLKQEHPQILTIIVADSADADNVIELINQAKIYRYIPAPYKLARLKHFIESALGQYQRYKVNPTLLRQQQAETSRELTQSSTGLMIMDRIKSLRKLFRPRGNPAG